jgi:hypothetical protein
MTALKMEVVKMVTVVRSATVMINFRIGDVATNQPNTVLCPKASTRWSLYNSKAKSPAHPTTTVPIAALPGKLPNEPA